jgi:hypothetical protein
VVGEPHIPGADIWDCPCDECLELEREATDDDVSDEDGPGPDHPYFDMERRFPLKEEITYGLRYR